MPCSICSQSGHNKRTCPENASAINSWLATASSDVVDPNAPVEVIPRPVSVPSPQSNAEMNQARAELRRVLGTGANMITPRQTEMVVWRSTGTHPIHRGRPNPFWEAYSSVSRTLYNMVPSTGVSAATPLPVPVPVPLPEPEVLKREPLPKHISVAVFGTLAEEDKRCQICLEDLTKDTLVLSNCGHNFCATCYEDARLVNCGTCRKTL